jgi:RHS repeat-associated protein
MPDAPTTPNGTTSYGYDSTQTFTTQTTLPTPSSGVQLATSASYDQQSGVPLSTTGLNPGQTKQILLYDPLLRPFQLSQPNGSVIYYNYEGTNQLGVGQQTGSGQYADTETLYDAYGRKSRVAVANGQSTNPWYQIDYCYDFTGLLQFQSLPYQGNGWGTPKQCSGFGTSYVYDALGRVTSTTNADGTASRQYNGRAVETTDINGVQRIAQYDPLGRISAVCEVSSSTLQGDSPQACGTDMGGTGFLTTYAYNLVNHTTTITQGAQTRIFTTDSAGRTISTTEPERGTTTYSYGYNGTGLQVARTRPRANQTNPSVTTTSTTQYDAVGRPVSITFNDGTQGFGWGYDYSQNWPDFTQNNVKGMMSEASRFIGSSWAAELFSYDSMGRIAEMNECLPSACGNVAYDKQLPYTYDLTGNLTSAGDGAGTTTSYTYSTASEVTSISSSLSGPTYPSALVSNVQNTPAGPQSYYLGNGLTQWDNYDSLNRLNGRWICIGAPAAACPAQAYGFGANWKGTRLESSADDVTTGGWGTSYGYDEFNRLTSAVLFGGSEAFSYGYDRYGNRWSQTVTQGSGPSPSYTFNKANNQISGYTYDAAGNMTFDGTYTYTYDAEGNIAQVNNGSTVVAVYSYNSLNQRVRVDRGSAATEYVFNASGQRVSTWDGHSLAQIQGQSYWGSRPVAFYSGGSLHFQHQDWEGTERVRTSYSGSTEGSYTSLPWGDAYSANGTDNDPYHFATLDHDSESSTEHAQYRQYSSTQGGWMSPDPYDGSYHVTNPQSLNRYAYVRNSPLGSIDPLGLDGCSVSGTNWYEQDGDGDPTGDPVYTTFTDIVCFVGGGGGGGATGASGGGEGSSAPNNLTPPNPCLFQGNAMSPGQYAAAGAGAAALGPVPFLAISGAGFPRGSYLDAQPQASGNVFQRAAYGNYSFGVYMASAGVPYAATMATANAFAMFSHYTAKNGPMDSTYTNLPNANVVNITNGFNAARNGTTCHR